VCALCEQAYLLERQGAIIGCEQRPESSSSSGGGGGGSSGSGGGGGGWQMYTVCRKPEQAS
jgi:hypothetical protein